MVQPEGPQMTAQMVQKRCELCPKKLRLQLAICSHSVQRRDTHISLTVFQMLKPYWKFCVKVSQYFFCFVDCASLYNLVNKTNLVQNLLLVYFVSLYMFRTSLDPSSGGTTVYTGCPRRNVPDFGRVFLMLKYTDIAQNTYVQI